ncbi:MAG: alpha-1,4-glucan--maltose-1-phosphate maltosyltransferase [Geodermatophilaceae bacterium]|nr:alpha-1,4-glucan--maltose-1-phosphate maltosyltransferase [Geodermatophilaceae bacterium]
MTGRLGITDISPAISCGDYPARAVVGEHLPISATVFREGHDKVGCNVVWTPSREAGGRKDRSPFLPMTPGTPGTDRWHATVVPHREGRWTFVLEAWSDPLATWRHAIEAKTNVGQSAQELANDLATGASLIDRATRLVAKEWRQRVQAAATALRDESLDLQHRLSPAFAPDLHELLLAHPVRELLTKSRRHEVWVDRQRALFGSWYEFFPRSEGGWEDGRPRHGTFKDAAERLPAIQDMAFDVVYLPPIHPIGEVNRKGPNNSLVTEAHDVGSPWAIGSRLGGHDAVHPDLGTIEDFDAFVERTRELGMEVALDFALQTAPDHPWVESHPEWFTTLPDGTIAYAENPPKKYQDIYPINFDNNTPAKPGDMPAIYAETLRVLTHWIDHGVKIFRVDNPHTKPLDFWHWLIWQVKQDHPDVLFLAEAFTRPAMMHTLAKIGFTQSYTYFTWRTQRSELEQYGRELVAAADYMRPNFFVNTPDILHESLQYGGPPMFKIRAVLAAMMSPTWGVYSGYELFEHLPVRPGSEEYLDSEKYQLRPRDWESARREQRTLAPYLTRLNWVRREHPALHNLRSLRFQAVDNPNIIAFSKQHGEDTVIVVCALDSHVMQFGTVALDMPGLGMEWHERFAVHDQITGETYHWGQFNYVELNPHQEPAHVFVARRYPS